MSRIEKVEGQGCLIEESSLQYLCERIDGALALTDAVPRPDNIVGNIARTGEAGTSDEAARADHVHPIRRQDNPGDPVIVPEGSELEMQDARVIRRWFTEEWVSFLMRCQVLQNPGAGWAWLVVPSIAGFQRPEITGVGTYRNLTPPVQIDTPIGSGREGAGPSGPYMGKEAHHWSGSQRIYMGYYRRDNPFRGYVEFTARYVRT